MSHSIFSKSEKYQTASCGFSLRVAQRDSVVIFFFGGGGPYQRDSRQLHKVKGGCSASALWINGNIQRSGVAPPPSALLNGDIQIYKWPWWRKRPWKIISSFIINERNSSRALCPLQTQFSNEKCCASPPPHPFPFSQFICLVPTPHALCGIHSFKCWSQGPALRIETQTGLTIFRIKEWDGERSILGVRLAGPGSSHSRLHRFCRPPLVHHAGKPTTSKTMEGI